MTMGKAQRASEIESGFVWGYVHQIHVIGDNYRIVEFVRDESPTPNFHPYVRTNNSAFAADHRSLYEDTAHSYDSLDEALIASVVFRNEYIHHGVNEAMNERLTSYVMRMLRHKGDVHA